MKGDTMQRHHTHTDHTQARVSVSRRRRFAPVLFAAATVGLASVTAGAAAASSTAHSNIPDHAEHGNHQLRAADQAAAMVATARYQDVEVAEGAGWASTINTLGCFQDATKGGMGVHYVNASLLDNVVDITKPEALVYELGANGKITGLVAHEYIVPVEAWTLKNPPRLFGRDFHRHPVLPLWVLHTWMWKPNPTGMFSDWNPAVRPCPSGVPIFGVDLPK
jgi:hypothetical protein